MKNIQEIAIAEYDYPLPDERIAKYPLAERDTSKLLLYKSGEIIEDKFSNLPSFIPQGGVDGIQQHSCDSGASAFPQGDRCAD